MLVRHEIAEGDVTGQQSIAMTTTRVESTSSLYRLNPFSLGSQGQVALASSARTSEKKAFVLATIGKFGLIGENAMELERRVMREARQEGLEPPTDGFGDRYSTN